MIRGCILVDPIELGRTLLNVDHIVSVSETDGWTVIRTDDPAQQEIRTMARLEDVARAIATSGPEHEKKFLELEKAVQKCLNEIIRTVYQDQNAVFFHGPELRFGLEPDPDTFVASFAHRTHIDIVFCIYEEQDQALTAFEEFKVRLGKEKENYDCLEGKTVEYSVMYKDREELNDE